MIVQVIMFIKRLILLKYDPILSKVYVIMYIFLKCRYIMSTECVVLWKTHVILSTWCVFSSIGHVVLSKYRLIFYFL